MSKNTRRYTLKIDYEIPVSLALVWNTTEQKGLGKKFLEIRKTLRISRATLCRLVSPPGIASLTENRLTEIEEMGGGADGIHPMEFIRLCELLEIDPEAMTELFTRNEVSKRRGKKILPQAMAVTKAARAIAVHCQRAHTPPWLGAKTLAKATGGARPASRTAGKRLVCRLRF